MIITYLVIGMLLFLIGTFNETLKQEFYHQRISSLEVIVLFGLTIVFWLPIIFFAISKYGEDDDDDDDESRSPYNKYSNDDNEETLP